MPGQVECGKSAHGQRPHVLVAQHRGEAARQRLIGQQRIQMKRHFGNVHGVRRIGDRRMQIRQRLRRPTATRISGITLSSSDDEAIGFVDEGRQMLAPVDRVRGASLSIKHWLARGLGLRLGGRCRSVMK